MKFNIESLIGQAALISIYLFFAIMGLSRLEELLSNPWANDAWLLDVLLRIAGNLFLTLLMAATLIRLPAIKTAAGLQPRISAILGSFLTLVLIVLPKTRLKPGDCLR